MGRGPEHIHSLSYEQAQAAVRSLAEQLYRRFGTGLRSADYVAVPRGGLIVLGMLSYFLDVRNIGIAGPRNGRTLVVVDDCGYSGARISRVLARYRDRKKIILALLCSPKELREAILSKEENVIACVSAVDLLDMLPAADARPRSAPNWRARWSRRLPGERYWIGLPELVVFPWTEPDSPIWNAEKQRLERGWRTASPDRCLKSWADLGLPPRTVNPEYRIPDGLMHRLVEDEVFLVNTRDDEIFHLTDSAAFMWRALAAYGNERCVLEALLRQFEVDSATLQKDLERFIDQLLQKALLERITN